MKKLFTIVFLLYVSVISSQFTYIPDSGFESNLVAQGIDSDGEINGQVLTSDIDTITILHLIGPSNSIADMTGIEDFLALEELLIWQQDITNINLSNNINLLQLDLSNNPLESLDISQNINIRELNVTASSLNSINLNTNLEIVHIYSTLLNEIDLSNQLELNNVRILGNHALENVNLQNGNNEGVLTSVLINFSNENLICVQVDNPEAVIAGEPPYEYWEIDKSITISDNCGVFSVEDNNVKPFYIYPNPAKELLYIEKENIITLESISVYDTTGKLIIQENTSFNKLDVSNLEKGLFLIHFVTDQGVMIKKLIKD